MIIFVHLPYYCKHNWGRYLGDTALGQLLHLDFLMLLFVLWSLSSAVEEKVQTEGGSISGTSSS